MDAWNIKLSCLPVRMVKAGPATRGGFGQSGCISWRITQESSSTSHSSLGERSTKALIMSAGGRSMEVSSGRRSSATRDLHVERAGLVLDGIHLQAALRIAHRR